LALLNGLVVGISACATSPETRLTLHQSNQGTVFLERITDRSFQAAHPISLPGDTVPRVLRGILMKQDQSTSKPPGSGKATTMRVFSEEEVLFLAPLIVDGLSRAAPHQQVRFTLQQAGPPPVSQQAGTAIRSSEPSLHAVPNETTSGFVYAYGRSLYVTLAQYRQRVERPDTVNIADPRLPDETGLVSQTVSFLPEVARRPDSYRDARSTDLTVVINYELLARLPEDRGFAAEPRRTAPPGAPRQPEPGTSAQRAEGQKDPEIEALRKELEDIKKQLAEQDARRNLVPSKQPPAAKNP
jgi:hypothetical protein